MSQQNVKCIEVTERELEGLVERAEYAQRLLKQISQQAYSESAAPADTKGALASLCRKLAKELNDYLTQHNQELVYGKKFPD